MDNLSNKLLKVAYLNIFIVSPKILLIYCNHVIVKFAT